MTVNTEHINGKTRQLNYQIMEKKEKYFMMRESDLLITDSADIGKTDLFVIKNLRWIKGAVATVFVVLLFTIAYISVSHKIELHRIAEENEYEVSCLIAEMDSIMMCYDESVRMNDLHDAIVEAVMDGSHEKATHDKVWEFIQRCNTWYPDIIMAQAVQESGCGKSAVAKRCNNLFGMTKPQSRKLRCDINRRNTSEMYAEYHNWKMSVIDRILWERWIFRNTEGKPTRDVYLCKVGTVYNTETNGYANHIDQVSKKYQQ
jgi:hypothetical protein